MDDQMNGAPQLLVCSRRRLGIPLAEPWLDWPKDISQGAVAPESPKAVVENWVRSHTSPER